MLGREFEFVANSADQKVYIRVASLHRGGVSAYAELDILTPEGWSYRKKSSLVPALSDVLVELLRSGQKALPRDGGPSKQSWLGGSNRHSDARFGGTTVDSYSRARARAFIGTI